LGTFLYNRKVNLKYFGDWCLDIIWNLGFGDWNLILWGIGRYVSSNKGGILNGKEDERCDVGGGLGSKAGFCFRAKRH
jgi:hypothetical protein